VTKKRGRAEEMNFDLPKKTTKKKGGGNDAH
jgi:hypothetical protein